VTGFDDDYLHRQHELTTVRADLERIGREAVELLVRVRRGELGDRTCHIQVPAPLVIRHTTGVRPAAPAVPEER
jgi:DNA-binding LacI/PurR family transcriptional regulator